MNKKLEDMSKEELVNLVIDTLTEQLKDVNFDWNLVNTPVEMYLPYSYEDNKKFYDYYKKSTMKYIFLVKPAFPDLYYYILNDIKDNNLIHEVRLLPFLTEYNLSSFTKDDKESN